MNKSLSPAQAIKKELKVLFPETKFSCKYKTYAGGSSVNISWVDWPIEDDVYRAINHYKYGSFDGQIDLYEYTNCRDDIPQTKYIFCNRKMSDNVAGVVNSRAIANFSNEQHRMRYYNRQTMARNLFSYYSITSDNIEVADTWATAWCWIHEKFAIVCK